MNVDFLITGEIDIVALYAALLSSMIAIWEVIKWRGRNAVHVSCKVNMQLIPSVDNQTYVVVTVINRGDRQTTITHFFGYYWDSWLDKIFNRNRKAFFINNHEIPKVIVPGEQWIGQVNQNEIEELASKGRMYIGICHSLSEKDLLVRVDLKNDTNTDRNDTN